MKKPQISIIVPVYNVEAYLRKCLDSIKAQTFTDWECILVDDGSRDSSPAICDEYAAADSRFKTIHKHNGGLSSARNAGLRIAQGEFIGFVDSDDWINPEMYQLLLDLIIKYDADISQGGFIKEFIGRRSYKHIVKHTKVISGAEAIRAISFNRLPNYAWNKLHRRHVITCDFPEGRSFEDIYVYGRWLKSVRKMVMDPSLMYHYRMRRGSIVHSNVLKNRYDFFLSSVDSMRVLDDSIFNEGSATFHKNAYINKAAVNAAKKIARKADDKNKRVDTILKIRNELNNYPIPPIRYIGLKQWWRATLLTKYPGLFISLMRAVNIFDLDVKDREKKCYD